MVSLTIFAIVMVISIGTLLVLIDANAKAQALYQSMTNLSFAVDSMTRNIRTANTYYCGALPSQLPGDTQTQDCPGGGSAIAFTRERDNDRWGYRFSNNRIEQKIESGPWIPLTSEDVYIESFTIIIDDTAGYYSGSDDEQPRISMLIKGHVENGLDTETDFLLQTNVTQRILNY